MTPLLTYHTGTLLTYYCPHVMAVVFLVFLFAVKFPGKGAFLLRAVVALAIASVLAHLNRLVYLWPAHPFFASGHMTFCLGLAISLGMLRPWTLAITLPLLIPLGLALVAYHFHNAFDILGAFPIVMVVYLAVHRIWTISPATPSLRRAVVSS